MSSHDEESDRRVAEFIRRHSAEHGFPPTVREICDAVGYSSVSTGQARIRRLVRQGMLRQRPGSPRSLTVTEAGGKLIDGTAEL